jgi:mono/diheme cytochrome c family protein
MGTNLKVFAVIMATLLTYTVVANSIPQVQSEVPEELSFTGEVTAEQLVSAGEQLYNGAGGCTACHGLGTRAPNLLTDQGGQGTIGARCGNRVSGKDCKAYLWESLTEPGAYVVEGFQPIMMDTRRTLSEPQIWSLVAFLQSHGGEVTVTGEDVKTAAAAPAGGQAAAAPGGSGSLDPRTIMQENQCLACHKLGAEGGPIGPPFDGMGGRINADRIRRGIIEPNAETAQGFEGVAGTMPQTFGQQLSAAQVEALVKYLSGLK